MNVLEKLGSWCNYLVLILVNIAYCPGIIVTPIYYNVVIPAIMALVVVSLLTNVRREWPSMLKMYAYYGIYVLVVGSIEYLVEDVFYLGVTGNIFLTITIFLLGYTASRRDRGYLLNCFKSFVFAAMFMGVYSVFSKIGGFMIVEEYVFNVKNSSGVLLSTAMILCLFLVLSTEKAFGRWFWVASYILLAICLLTFRCRTAIVVAFVCTIFVLFRTEGLKSVVFRPSTIFMVVIFVVVCSMILPENYGYDAIFAGRDATDANSVTSGRINQVSHAWRVFNENQLLGCCGSGMGKSMLVDNYVMAVLANYGLFGALLVFPAYLIAIVFCFWELLKTRVEDSYGLLILFGLLITSISEGSYPFGPGTPVMCGYFLLGWWYKSTKIPID